MEPYNADPQRQLISSIVIEADFLQKKSSTSEQFNTDQMSLAFKEQFMRHGFSVRQPLVFKFQDKKTLSLVVREIEGKNQIYTK